MKKVFLEDLPKTKIGGNVKGKLNIDWIKSKGYKIKFIYEDIQGEVQIIDYNKSYLTIKYNNKQFEIKSSQFKDCHLGKILNVISNDFKLEIGQTFKDDKRNITITDKKYIKNKRYYKYKCNRCGFDGGNHWSIKDKEYKNELWSTESNLLHEQGCSCCGSKIVVKNINSIYHTDPWMIPYIGEECAKTHTHGSQEKVKVTCLDCGKIKDKKVTICDIYIKHSIGCTCGDGFSYGHKYIFNLLTQLGQNFIDNYTFDWSKFYNTYKDKEASGEYDFVLKDKKLIIEVDGDFHRKDNRMNGQTKEESKFLDDEKDRLAQEHGYKVIRISDEGDIKQNILDSDLNKLFNLNNIEWIKCEEFALSNRVKEACKLKKTNTQYTTCDIAKIMNISKKTIIDWLKKGNTLNWCNYDAKEEMRESAKIAHILNCKKIKMYKSNELVGIFDSATYLEDMSKEMFGVELNHLCIAKVCRKERRTYKKYIFQYATKEEYEKWLQQNQQLIHKENLGQAM